MFLENTPTAIDSSVSSAIKKADVISLAKNFVENEKNIETKIIASKFHDETGTVTSGQGLCPKFGYFSEQTTNFNMNMVNYPENSIIYLNQGCLTIKNNKKIFYADYYILGQIIKTLNYPEDIYSYVCREREVKIIRPRYEPTIAEFLGLHKTIGFIAPRGDDNEHFLNYG